MIYLCETNSVRLPFEQDDGMMPVNGLIEIDE